MMCFYQKPLTHQQFGLCEAWDTTIIPTHYHSTSWCYIPNLYRILNWIFLILKGIQLKTHLFKSQSFSRYLTTTDNICSLITVHRKTIRYNIMLQTVFLNYVRPPRTQFSKVIDAVVFKFYIFLIGIQAIEGRDFQF